MQVQFIGEEFRDDSRNLYELQHVEISERNLVNGRLSAKLYRLVTCTTYVANVYNNSEFINEESICYEIGEAR